MHNNTEGVPLDPATWKPYAKLQAELEPLVEQALELSAADLVAEHTGRAEWTERYFDAKAEVVRIGERRKGDRRQTITHENDGEVWAPVEKLGELLAIATELDSIGRVLLAARLRAALGLKASA